VAGRPVARMVAIRSRRVRDLTSMSDGMRAQHGNCDHRGLLEVEWAGGYYRMRCTLCGEIGPTRKTPEAARKALLVLGARDGTRAPRG
jgi:hypothetical protein